ncbi:hypothetical protein DLH72_02185 [Candidatus Gracilibacteria bacterium]|nr:MAG: hypothetical protein DLH72_02185 [Candidatus Gracilibacteria bacterium]
MSFLSNFSFAFQKISLIKDIFEEGEYGEKKKIGIEKKDFLGVIQREKNFSEISFDENGHFKMNSRNYTLRCNTKIEPRKGDIIESFGDRYDVISVEKVIIEGKHDHNMAIIKMIS